MNLILKKLKYKIKKQAWKQFRCKLFAALFFEKSTRNILFDKIFLVDSSSNQQSTHISSNLSIKTE